MALTWFTSRGPDWRANLAPASYSRVSSSTLMLPTELIDMVIDHLHDDRPSLRSCALVSRTWLVSSRYHLFYKIKLPLSSSSGELSLEDVLTTFESPLGSQCTSFVHICSVATSEAPSYFVTELCIELATLGRLVSMLPRLRVLLTIGIAWPAPSAVSPPLLTSTSATALVVCRVESPTNGSEQPFKSIRDGLEILRVLPALKALHVLRGGWGHAALSPEVHSSIEPPPFPSDLRLESLDLRADGPVSNFIDYTVKQLNFSCLTTVSIWSFYTEDIPSIGRLMRAAAGSLRHLELRLTHVIFLDYNDEPEPREVIPRLSLSGCMELEKLQLFIPIDITTKAEDYVPYWDIVNAILDNLPPSVQEILFVLDAYVHEDDMEESLDLVQWQDQIRAYSRLPELKNVTFSAGESKTADIWKLPPAMTRLISMYLSDLQARSILRFYSRPAASTWYVDFIS